MPNSIRFGFACLTTTQKDQIVTKIDSHQKKLSEYNIPNIDMLTTCPPIFVDKYIKDIELVKEGGYLRWLVPMTSIKFFLTKKGNNTKWHCRYVAEYAGDRS